jgi:hypothetical protein
MRGRRQRGTSVSGKEEGQEERPPTAEDGGRSRLEAEAAKLLTSKFHNRGLRQAMTSQKQQQQQEVLLAKERQKLEEEAEEEGEDLQEERMEIVSMEESTGTSSLTFYVRSSHSTGSPPSSNREAGKYFKIQFLCKFSRYITGTHSLQMRFHRSSCLLKRIFVQ